MNLIILTNHVKHTILEFKKVEDTNLLRLQATSNDKFLSAFMQIEPPINAYTVLSWFWVSIAKNNLEKTLLLQPEIPNSSLGDFLQKIIKLLENNTSSTIVILCTQQEQTSIQYRH
jgi:hypothetical protein